jgi:hypothetical protein
LEIVHRRNFNSVCAQHAHIIGDSRTAEFDGGVLQEFLEQLRQIPSVLSMRTSLAIAAPQNLIVVSFKNSLSICGTRLAQHIWKINISDATES